MTPCPLLLALLWGEQRKGCTGMLHAGMFDGRICVGFVAHPSVFRGSVNGKRVV